jgi:hypothetical protein
MAKIWEGDGKKKVNPVVYIRGEHDKRAAELLGLKLIPMAIAGITRWVVESSAELYKDLRNINDKAYKLAKRDRSRQKSNMKEHNHTIV